MFLSMPDLQLDNSLLNPRLTQRPIIPTTEEQLKNGLHYPQSNHIRLDWYGNTKTRTNSDDDLNPTRLMETVLIDFYVDNHGLTRLDFDTVRQNLYVHSSSKHGRIALHPLQNKNISNFSDSCIGGDDEADTISGSKGHNPFMNKAICDMINKEYNRYELRTKGEPKKS